MGIVLAPSLIVSPPADFGPNRPVIGWHNLVTFTSVSADSEDTSHPVTNLGNSSTNLYWLSASTAVQYLTVELGAVDSIDYVALARHNFGSAGIIVSVEGRSAEPGADWVELFPEFLPADDAPMLLRFAAANLLDVRVKLQPDGVEPRAAIFYAGKLLVMQKGVAVGHVPLPYGRQRSIIAGRSEGGEYLGRIETGGVKRSSVMFSVLTPDFYRDEIDAFVEAAPPFFFAWAPQTYPDEVGFAWVTSDVVPTPTHAAGFISLTLEMEGLAL